MRSHHVQTLTVKNFRSLAALELSLGPINVFFGPNGVGKSSLLDTLWFLRDCAARGLDHASSDRDHGVGMLWFGAEENARIELGFATELARYSISMGLSGGRIEPRAAERLSSRDGHIRYLERAIGSDRLSLHVPKAQKKVSDIDITLREPQWLGIESYLTMHPNVVDVQSIDTVLRVVKRYACRAFGLHVLKRKGSESSHEQWLWERGENAWSVLRNVQGRQRVDERWNTIRGYMQEAFPTFHEIVFEQTGPNAVYASFLEHGVGRPIFASGVSDGHLHMLLLLTAMFAEPESRGSIVIFDEPDLSLHPWALAVFAKAVKKAAESWGKQIIIATHSPVLLSQFEPQECFTLSKSERGTRVTRVSEIEGLDGLLENYALGSLFMAETIAGQSASGNHEP